MLVCRLTATAQEEHWDTYMARYGEKPGSVLVDMALMSIAPDRKYPYLLITGPHSQNCGKQGIPANEDIADLEGILDATTNFVTGVTAKVLTGTFTYNCDRLNYYYIKDTMGVRNALGRMYSRSYGTYNYTIKIKHDPEWVSYRSFLYPDSATARWMEYNRKVTGMMELGDSLTKQRDINFEAYFRSDSDRNGFAGFAAGKGYKQTKAMLQEGAAAPYKIVVSKFGYVKMDMILAGESELAEAVKKYHGIYNGWDAPLSSLTNKK